MAPQVNDLEPMANTGIIRRPSAVARPPNQGNGSDIDQALVHTNGWAKKNFNAKRRELWDAICKEEEKVRTQIRALEKARGQKLNHNEHADARKEAAIAFRRAYWAAVNDCLANDPANSPRPLVVAKGVGAPRAKRETETVTILHDLIQYVSVEDFKNSELYLELVKMSLELLWDRFGASGTGLSNALRKAIELDPPHTHLIMAICRIPEWEDPNLRKLIATAIAQTAVTPSTGGRENCLHAAILNFMPPAVLDAVVRYADGTALKSKRTPEDNTPLHDFVSFADDTTWRFTTCSCKCRTCLDRYDGVFFDETKLAAAVETTMVRMIDRYEEALSTTNKDGKTPYVLHIETRRNQRGNSWDDLEFEREKVAADNLPKDDKPPPLRSVVKMTDNHGVQEADNPTGVSTTLNHHPHGQTSLSLEPMSKKGGPQTNTQLKPQGEHVEEWNFSRHVARTVSAKLLERCCSRPSWDKAVKSIFGEHRTQGTDRDQLQTSFVLKGGVYKGFEQDCGYMPLSPILSYVELELCRGTPYTHTRHSDAERTAHTETPRLVRSENVQNLRSVFLWLKQQKKVKRILKLVIIDNQEWQCSDETMQESLADWDVRYLDWNKRDLSVDAISSGGAKGLIELRLAWSGQNTALIGWSHPNFGIGSFLPKLRRLHIDVPSSIESVDRMKLNLASFQARLETTFPSIAFAPPEDVKTSLARDSARHRASDPDISNENHHRWIEAVENFRNEAMATSHQLRPGSVGQPNVVQNPIKVALIDDGVSLKNLDHKGLVKDGWPLDIPDEDRIVTTYYDSTVGHGTAMANLVHFVCPEAHLYVAKLERQPPKVYRCIAGMAADAVAWAISKDVDIISMSWTIKSEHQRSEDVQRLNEAMHKAQERGTILFCSFNDVGNHGSDQDELLPSTKAVPLLRRVGSCNGNGKESEFVNEKLVHYLFPGEQLSQIQQISERAGTDKGSSASTALASGLAALVLWCVVRLGGDKKEFENKRMNKLFDAMKTDPDPTKGSLVDVSADMDSARKRGGAPIDIVETFVRYLRNKIAKDLSEWQRMQEGTS